jgi:hypothetical protein
MLSRPGPAQSRILTSLGFARFRIGDRRPGLGADLRGAGMFERSHRSSSPPRVIAETAEADNGES